MTVIEGTIDEDTSQSQQSSDVAPNLPQSTSLGRKRSRARSLLARMGRKIEEIKEEPGEEDKRHPGVISVEERARPRTLSCGTPPLAEMQIKLDNIQEEHPSTSSNDSTIPADEQISPISAQSGPRDPVDDYYKRNIHQNFMTDTSLYEKSTELRRVPDYIKQASFQSRERRMTMQSRNSRRSRASSKSTRSRLGLPQQPALTHSNKFTRSFYYLVSKHRLLGFRHILMLTLILIYTLMGATIFMNIEGPVEKANLASTNLELLDAIRIIGQDLRIAARTTNDSLDHQLKNAYIKLLEIDGKFGGSTFYKLENGPDDPKLTWTFKNAMFFSFTVYTTIGYGSIAPITVPGKLATVAYTFIFLPLTMVIIRDIGQFLLVFVTKVYARLLIRLRHVRGYVTPDTESISLPIKFAQLMSTTYIISGGVFIYNYDAWFGPPDSGLDLFDSLYFSFISITTVGFGDILPNNATYSPLIATIFFFGLPMMRVVNRCTYIALENGFFGTIAMMEHRLDRMIAPAAATTTPSRRQSTATPVTVANCDPEKPASISGTIEADGKTDKVINSADDYSLYYDDESGDDDDEDEEARARNELLNNFTIHSIATFMRNRSDVYGGDFGRVNVRKADLQ